MNNAQKAQAFLDTSINGTGGLILHAYESIEIITALLAEREALIADLGNLPRHIDHPEIDAIIDKYRGTK